MSSYASRGRMHLEIVGAGARQLRSSCDVMQDVRYRHEKSIACGQFQTPRDSLHVSFDIKRFSGESTGQTDGP